METKKRILMTKSFSFGNIDNEQTNIFHQLSNLNNDIDES